jgi:hypothetical protein
MKIHFSLPPGYDFVLDPSHKKKPAAQKEFKEFVMQDMGNDQTPVTAYLNNNAYRITKKDILDIFIYINTVAGVNVITAELKADSGDPHAKFRILDTDLQKQERIKQIHAQNKAINVSKDDVASRVWKYRYIPHLKATILKEMLVILKN